MLSQSSKFGRNCSHTAMAFFSIMILSMVSMDVSSAEDHSKIAYSQSLRFQGSSETSRTKNLDGISNTTSTDSMVIFYDGIFYDGHLNHLENQNFCGISKILAVSPDLPSSRSDRSAAFSKDLTPQQLTQRMVKLVNEEKAK